jgi:hypothetical protein
MAFKIFSVIRARFFNQASDTALDIGLNGETQPKLSIDAGGKISWGAGDVTAVDTNLYRDGANVLKTDDTFKAAALYVDGIEIDPTGASLSQFLTYDGEKFVPATVNFGSSDVSQLDDLLDVDIGFPAEGQILRYDGVAWTNASLAPEITDLEGLTDVDLTSPANGQTLIYNGSEWVNDVFPNAEPMGHEDKSQSTVSFNESTRTFTIQPASTSFTVWVKGKRFVKTTAQTVTIPDTSGLYYISFDATGTLQYTVTTFDWGNEAPTAYVYWNATDDKAYFFADERHGVTLDWQTHEYLHRTRGAAYASGFTIGAYSTTGDGTSNADMQFDLAGGTFFDEDLEVVITHSATPTANTWEQVLEGGAEIPIFYHDGTIWKHTTPTEYAVKQGTLPQYNLLSAGTWSTPDLTTDTYGVTWVAATNNLNYPVIGILGQKNYANLNKVAEDSWESLILTGLPIFELRPLYKIAYLVSSTFTNTPKAAIRQVIDIRTTSSIASGVAATATNDHGGLLGLTDDDHAQYVHISVNRTISATHTFTNGLNSSGPITASSLTVAGGSALGLFDIVEIALEDTSANQQLDSTQASAIKYMVRADNGANADTTEIMALLDGTTVNFVEYGRVGTSGTDLAEYSVAQSSGNVILRATPSSANTTFHIIKTVINA